MKKLILFAAYTLLVSASNLEATVHNLKENGLVAALNSAYARAENPADLPQIVTKYYNQVQKGNYDIDIGELQSLYEELCKIKNQGSKHQL